MIVFFSNDLMFQSRISAAVRAANESLVCVRSLEQLQSKFDPASAPLLVILDLAYRELDLAEAIPAIRTHYPQCRIWAYGPHVDVERLNQAVDLGADQVMTRGQFDRDMAPLIATLVKNTST